MPIKALFAEGDQVAAYLEFEDTPTGGVKGSSPQKALFFFYGEGYFAEGSRPWELDIAPNSYTFIVKKWTVRKNLSKS